MENISCVGDLSKVLLDNYDGDWHLYFYKASNRKYKTKKIDISDDLIRGIRASSIEKYNEKLIQSLGLVEYGSFDDLHMLKALSLSDESISMMYQLFMDTLFDRLPKEALEESPLLDRDSDGYVMIKMLEEEGNIPLILGFKSKPVKAKKPIQFHQFEEGYDQIDNRDFIELSDKIDYVIYGDTLYSLDYKFEKVFWVGDFNKLKVLNILEDIEKTGRILPSGMFALRNSKQKRQMLKYDRESLELITDRNVDILNNYGDFTLNGKQLAFEDDYSAKIMIKLFTNKLFFLDGKAWIGDKKELEKPLEEVKFED